MELQRKLHRTDRILMVIIAVGFLLNTYAFYVELKHEYDPSYQALCDVNSVISCTKVITTKWGKGFGILPESVAFRNPIFGFVFYTLMLLMIMAIKPNIIVCKSIIFLAILSNLATIYLSILMIYIIQYFCLICIISYIVNFLLLIYSIVRYQLLKQLKSKSKLR
ncbi:transmembrane and tpr repeat-containing protein 3-like protein [Dermatophagoides farinae]|uniref:vitamin-K-epoxide reductase (warfarin-sensitive) n=1 Tax=Dermatophagoides farinae TaxID=6954 RepID=A0A9D4SDR6_DERFA|nr:vitamin K epoxide reductase complex subunit 1-like protein 1 [Dermatophagoides farinae]KAH7637928.1 transmembrane and tpr repeat-containing protein 3-like protein [Dermatophagoides farinae]